MSDAFHRPWWNEPGWVSDGETVWLVTERDFDTGKARAVKCVVAVAAGNHARIVNEERQIDRWVALASLLVPPDDPRHPNQRRRTEAAVLAALRGEP